MKQKRWVKSAVALTLAMGAAQAEERIDPVPKPLQFVLMAFDGSELISRWEDTRSFAHENHLKFTYFVSGVMFLGREMPNGRSKASDMILSYQGPQHRPGQSDIGFSEYAEGNSATNQPIITERIRQMNLAKAEGNELGSHGNGHFDASKWSTQDWEREFTDFNHLLFSVLYPGARQTFQVDRSNFLKDIDYKETDIRGYRTPYLSQNAQLYPVLQKFKFRYDTSKIAEQNYWPELRCYDGSKPYDDRGNANKNCLWNFPLAEVKLAHAEPWEASKTLSMDYNFYVSNQPASSRAAPKDDVSKKELFKQQMLETYRNYFRSNYDGNRAPVHLGHHFALWNGGAYWEAMKQFAQEVCSLRDVRCITYQELTEFMDSLTPAELQAYREGKFTSSTAVRLGKLEAPARGRKIAHIEESLEHSEKQLEELVRSSDPRSTAKIEKLKRHVKRWKKFRWNDETARYDRETHAWLKDPMPPEKLETQALDMSYLDLVEKGYAHCVPGQCKHAPETSESE